MEMRPGYEEFQIGETREDWFSTEETEYMTQHTKVVWRPPHVVLADPYLRYMTQHTKDVWRPPHGVVRADPYLRPPCRFVTAAVVCEGDYSVVLPCSSCMPVPRKEYYSRCQHAFREMMEFRHPWIPRACVDKVVHNFRGFLKRQHSAYTCPFHVLKGLFWGVGQPAAFTCHRLNYRFRPLLSQQELDIVSVPLLLDRAWMEPNNGDHECAICMEPMQEPRSTINMPCAHTFHRSCLAHWFHHGHESCPTCRYWLPVDQDQALAVDQHRRRRMLQS